MTETLRSNRKLRDLRTGNASRQSRRSRKTVLPSLKPSGRRSPRRSVSQSGPYNPPVMVRTNMAAQAPAARKRSKTRRRYDVALGVPGAEMRLPALPQVHFGWRLISLVMVALLGAALYHLWNSPKYQVETVKVNGLQRLSSDQVNVDLNLAGQPIFSLNPAALRDQLMKDFPELKSAAVSVAWPNKVTVTVSERLPVLTWQQDGKTLFVDADGMAFAPRPGEKPLGPVILASSSPPVLLTGEQPAQTSLQDQLAAINQTSAAAQSDKAAASPAQPAVVRPWLTPQMVAGILTLAKQAPKGTNVVYDRQHGLGWKDAGGWNVYFGDGQDMAMKLNVYKAIVKQLKSEDITPTFISVEYAHAPYYHAQQ
jgi:cell division septal protein FtsQ